MKLAVLGATGGTGLCLVQQALKANHHVTAIVRDPSKITFTNDNLKIEKANLFSEEELGNVFKEQDAVMSCLGNDQNLALTPWRSSTFYEDSVKTIVGGMRIAGVNKFICVTASGARLDNRMPFFWKWMSRVFLARGFLNSMVVMEDYLVSECKDITFVVVKPPQLLDKPLADAEFVAVEDDIVPESASMSVPKANIAKFMLQSLSTDEWNNKLVAVSIKK